MKKLFLLLFSVLAFTSQVRADVEWTIWEGSINMSTTKGEWNNSLYLNNNNFKNLAKGDKLHLEFSKNAGVEGDAQIALEYQVEKVNKTNPEDKSWPHTRFKDIYTSTSNFDIDITDDILGYLKDKDDGTYTYRFINIVIYGHDYTLTKVSIKKHFSVIKTTLSDADVSLGDWSAQYDVASSKLSNVKAGDYFYVPATKQMTKGDNTTAVEWWQAQFYYDKDGWKDLYNVNSVDHDIWAEIQEADVSNITSNDFHLKGQYYNCTGVYLLHPINSFKIGSIGMATFSADQEVTVPEGLTAYKATVSGNNVTLTPFTNNVIPAGKGAIIKGNEGSIVEFVASNNSSKEDSALQPVTTATEVTTLADEGYDLYVLYNSPTGNIPLSLEDLNCGWGSSYNSTNKTITFDSAGQGRGWGWNFDYSDYSKIVVEFESAPSAGVLKVQYNEPENYAEESGYSAGATSVEIDLNAGKKNSVHQVYLSASTAGTLTLTNAYLVKNGVPEFRKTESGTIAANKAYLKIPTGTPSKLNIVFAEDEEQQGETTSIRNMTNTNVNNNVVYNMNGQRVGSDYKGLVIVNGKKIIKK